MRPMHSKDILAQELDRAGLNEMADKARAGYYHDFLSPLPNPAMQLEVDLREAGPAAAVLRERHLNGEFAATMAESEEWAESPEGQDALGKLATGR